jgi:hypothetical protein
VEPEPDINDAMITVLLARVGPHGQHDYLKFTEAFRADSMELDRAIAKVTARVNTELPRIVGHFLTECRRLED